MNASTEICIMMNRLIISFLLLSNLLMHSCKEESICTEEFSMIGLVLPDSALDDHYTIQMETGDTLRFNTYQYDHWYAVLTDQYRDDLKNKSALFQFEGIRKQKVVVKELFEIGADHCHIYKISGKDSL
jgi:hypothetical protein